MALCNLGKRYDEDVDVKIYIPSGHVCFPVGIPVPDYCILDIAIQTFETIYQDNKSVSIDQYRDYPIRPVIPKMPNTGIAGLLYNDDTADKRKEFSQMSEDVFCYECFSEDGNDVVCYNQSYLKQSTNSLLPSYLVFNLVPEVIKYEIVSKHCSDVVKGELRIEQ